MQELDLLKRAIIEGDEDKAVAITSDAIKAGISPILILNDYVAPAMDEVARRYESYEYFLPELILSCEAMKRVREVLQAYSKSVGASQNKVRIVIGTVRGDVHDIGKNLVAAMLEGAGFEVYDLGVDVAPERFVETVIQKKAQFVAMSALLTTTMPAMKDTIDALRKAGLREMVKVLVGGAPVSQRFADEIGADGYSENAPGAVQCVRRLIRTI